MTGKQLLTTYADLPSEIKQPIVISDDQGLILYINSRHNSPKFSQFT
jgi:hypothetical protein